MYTPGLSVETGLRQELHTSVLVYQIADIVQMTLTELTQKIDEEVAENPFLEKVEPETPPAEKPEEKPADDIDWEAVVAESYVPAPRSGAYEILPDMPETQVADSNEGLDQYLTEQLRWLRISERDKEAASEIIYNLDERGWLTLPLDDLGTSNTLFTEAELVRGLEIVRTLEPRGVGARSLQDCLLLQIGDSDAHAAAIVRDHYNLLTRCDLKKIASLMKLDATELRAALAVISRLDPRPGSRYQGGAAQYVQADLVAEKVDGEWTCRLNDGEIPSLQIAKTYRHVLASRRTLAKEDRDFVRTRLGRANFFRAALEQRRWTLLQVGRLLVQRQARFIETGPSALEPFTQEAVAELLLIATSTVSRAVSGKYIRTPRGALPLKAFFSSRLSASGGDDKSGAAVREHLKTLVDSEDAADPFSDQEISNRLKAQGISVERRTIAKYRDILGIPARQDRKRLKASLALTAAA